MQGMGVMTWIESTGDVTGDRYEGEWKDGEAHGQGVRTWRDGSRYEGQFAHGLMAGTGVHTEPNGDRYSGMFKAGMYDGQGVMTWTVDPTPRPGGGSDPLPMPLPRPFFLASRPENIPAMPPDDVIIRAMPTDDMKGVHRYEGEWKDGEKHGQGVRTWPDGSRYEGQFKGDTMHGQGVHTTPNGPRYEGTYNLGKRRGHGVIIYPGEQERFEGQFADDHPVSDKDHYPVGSLPGTVFSQEPQAASVIDNSP